LKDTCALVRVRVGGCPMQMPSVQVQVVATYTRSVTECLQLLIPVDQLVRGGAHLLRVRA
jgi:hypothetical protein